MLFRSDGDDVKRLMNKSEEQTNTILRPLTEEWGSHTFPKVRLADILPIENSGISSDLYHFALQSHFDFVVTDDDLQPLFAIEFDGDSHDSKLQQRRDMRKDSLCERFQLPLLRINSLYLNESFRRMDMLSWFVNYWFAQRMIDGAYESGDIPADAYVDPMLIVTLPGTKQKFPLWLTAEVRTAFNRYCEKGLSIDPGPSSFIGVDANGAHRAIVYLAITENEGLLVETAMRAQRFNVPCAEILEAIAEHQMFDTFNNVINGDGEMVSIDAICTRLRWYGENCSMMTLSVGTQSERLRAATPELRIAQ